MRGATLIVRETGTICSSGAQKFLKVTGKASRECAQLFTAALILCIVLVVVVSKH